MENVLAYLRTLKRMTKKYNVWNNGIEVQFYLELLGRDLTENHFFMTWENGNYEDRTNAVIDKLLTITNHPEIIQLKKMLNALPHFYYKISYDICTCGSRMVADREELQMRCACGIEVPMPIISNDAQFYGQEGQSAKPGIFNPSKHYRNWIDLILGVSSTIPIDVINKCRNYIHSNSTIQDVRTTLREMNRTDLTKHASAVWSQVIGQPVPKVSSQVLAKGESLFIQVLEARNHIKELHNRNRKYYRYYIFKILDLLIPFEHPDRRILHFKHLQGSDTVEKNDNEWRLICEKLQLEWRSTTTTLRNERRRF